MSRGNLTRAVLIASLLLGFAALQADAVGDGTCTACVQVDAGYHGCAVEWGNASFCYATSNGQGCMQGGNASTDGCYGGWIIN